MPNLNNMTDEEVVEAILKRIEDYPALGAFYWWYIKSDSGHYKGHVAPSDEEKRQDFVACGCPATVAWALTGGRADDFLWVFDQYTQCNFVSLLTIPEGSAGRKEVAEQLRPRMVTIIQEVREGKWVPRPF